MEGRREAVIGWEFEFVCHFINLFCDGKRPTVYNGGLASYW